MIQLAPTMVEALGVYSVAAAVAMVSMAAGAILSQLPSRKMKGEGRSVRAAVERQFADLVRGGAA